MALRKIHNIKTIEDLLESDDELPGSCNETTETPSYLNDDRFDKIRFDWIYDKKLSLNESNFPKNNNDTVEGDVRNVDAPGNFIDGIPKKRVLKRNDIYCLQSVQNHLSSNLLTWFADFLMLKDMQSKYKTFRGCLVYENVCNEFKFYEHKTKAKREYTGNNQKSKCKILLLK